MFMEENPILTMSADEIIKQFQCTALEDFDDVLTYEIKKQYISKQ